MELSVDYEDFLLSIATIFFEGELTFIEFLDLVNQE
jgi:hypothetical protein